MSYSAMTAKGMVPKVASGLIPLVLAPLVSCNVKLNCLWNVLKINLVFQKKKTKSLKCFYNNIFFSNISNRGKRVKETGLGEVQMG